MCAIACALIEFASANKNKGAVVKIYKDGTDKTLVEFAIEMDWQAIENLANGLLQLKKQHTGGYAVGGSLIASL